MIPLTALKPLNNFVQRFVFRPFISSFSGSQRHQRPADPHLRRMPSLLLPKLGPLTNDVIPS